MLQSGPAGLIKTEDSFFLRNGLDTFQPELFIKMPILCWLARITGQYEARRSE